MKAAAFLGVLLVARGLVLAGRELPASPWALPAYLWQDVACALSFAALELALRRWPRAVRALYAAACAYIALNVPVTRILSTPLTAPMLRAARGTLGDSIAHYVTPANLGLMALVLATAALLPRALRRARPRQLLLASVLALPVLALGPAAAARIDTKGLERNAFAALISSTMVGLPGPPAGSSSRDWHVSPFPGTPGEDLTELRGRGRGRNVVLILLESTGARFLAPYGAVEDPMPHLTRLAEEALLFEHAYAVYPESIKGLFSTLCATSPAFRTAPEAHASAGVPSLAHALARAGYRTGLFHSGRFGYLGMDAIVAAMGFETLEDAGHIGGNHESSFGVDEPSAVKRVLAWIDGLPRQAPFFAVYLPVAGHHPYETPEKGPFPEKELTGMYRNALRYGDAAVALLLDGLRARGRYDESIFVLAGDHGEAFGEHAGNFGHTFYVHEENVHVPCLIVAPRLIERGRRVGHVASLLDLAPTVLDLLGLEAPAAWEGRTLLEPAPRMALFFTDYSLGLLGLRDGPWKLIHELDTGRTALFDLARDPLEQRDLADGHAERVKAYRETVLGWSAERRARVWR